MAEPLPDWLAARAAATPDRVALTADGRAWNFAELHADVDRAARRLAACGVGAGDRVATLLPNGAAAAVLVHAALRLGAILVPLNTRLAPPELAWQLGDAAPRLLLTDGRFDPLTAAAGAPVRTVRLAEFDAMAEADGALRLAHEPDTPLAILYTSGTTGRPKGAILTVGNFWWSAVGSALNLGVHTGDRWLACLPLFHVGGLSILVRSAIYGTAAVVHDGFDAAAVNRAIDAEGVTLVSVVAVMLDRMLAERARGGPEGDRAYPPSLRCVLLGGGPAPRPLLERCAALGVPVVQTYGLTESCSQVATLAPEDALRKLGAAGRALYPNTVRVVDADGRDVAVGAPGEILVRGPVVTAGYWNRPDATARAIVDGWLQTGDAGTLDADGYLYVLDRRDDLIVTGGENVYPAEVEAALLADARIAEVGVIGVPDATWGQRVVAVVRLADGAIVAHPDDLREACRARLAGYKVPRELRLVDAPLPRTAAGKLRRAALRDGAGAA